MLQLITYAQGLGALYVTAALLYTTASLVEVWHLEPLGAAWVPPWPFAY